jgi:indolepyruvate decarboxylase
MLLHHQVKRLDSQFAIYREITCDQASLHDPASAPREIARVLHSCLTQSRPVYLELPRDVVFERCARVQRLPEAGFDAEAVAACADEIMERLRRAALRARGRPGGHDGIPPLRQRAARGARR